MNKQISKRNSGLKLSGACIQGRKQGGGGLREWSPLLSQIKVEKKNKNF